MKITSVMHAIGLSVFALFIGCGQRVCDPGKQVACACGYGVEGSQACNADGTAFGSCKCPGGGGGSGGGGSGGGGGGAEICDDEADCEACFDCTYATTCSGEADACFDSVDCSGLFDCIGACASGDDICAGDCYNAYPDSAADALIDLQVCGECDCADTCGTCQ